MNKGMLFVISGPSASGKDTIIKQVMDKLGDASRLSVSMTTRQRREGERDGVNYHYVTEEDFKEHLSSGKMLEFAQYGMFFYGTPIEPVERWLSQGKIVFLIIEVQGGEKIKRLFPDSRKIFVLPPSLEELERRLRGRGTDKEDSIVRRMGIATSEIMRADEYDYIVENDDLNQAVDDMLSIIRAEQLCTENMKSKIREVINNA